MKKALITIAFASFQFCGNCADLDFSLEAMRNSRGDYVALEIITTASIVGNLHTSVQSQKEKAQECKKFIFAVSEGILSSKWSPPEGGWKLLYFPEKGNLTFEEISSQPREKLFYTKLVAKNIREADRLTCAGAAFCQEIYEGNPWASELLLGVVRGPDNNLKRLAYAATRDFGIDGAVEFCNLKVDWNEWQETYNKATKLGKAIILRNVFCLAMRKEEHETAKRIMLSALNSKDKELQAIALAFGYYAFTSEEIKAKAYELAENASDPQIQALAKEYLK